MNTFILKCIDFTLENLTGTDLAFYDEYKIIQNRRVVLKAISKTYEIEKALNELNPSVVLITQLNLKIIRAIELYNAIQIQIKPDLISEDNIFDSLKKKESRIPSLAIKDYKGIEVYLLIYKDSIEDYVYFQALNNEKKRFQQLISTKSVLYLITINNLFRD